MRGNGFLPINRLQGIFRTPKFKSQPKPGSPPSPICPDHRCHMKFVGHNYNSAYRKQFPTWACPIHRCRRLEQRIPPPR